jgi:hypothetical protein
MRTIHDQDYLNQSEILEQLAIKKETFKTIRENSSSSYQSGFPSQVKTQISTPDEIKLRSHNTHFPKHLEINGEYLWKAEDVAQWRTLNF